jgi:hypothetical protein
MTTQQESKAGHTPTPWYNTNDVLTGKEIISSDALDGRYIADIYNRSDSDFIIRAVNNHSILEEIAHDLACGRSADAGLKALKYFNKQAEGN